MAFPRIIYYIEINYMFRHYSLAIFKLIMRNLISSYSRFACVVYSGEVKGEVGTRSRMQPHLLPPNYIQHM